MPARLIFALEIGIQLHIFLKLNVHVELELVELETCVSHACSVHNADQNDTAFEINGRYGCASGPA